jgi:hypothetical protein
MSFFLFKPEQTSAPPVPHRRASHATSFYRANYHRRRFKIQSGLIGSEFSKFALYL